MKPSVKSVKLINKYFFSPLSLSLLICPSSLSGKQDKVFPGSRLVEECVRTVLAAVEPFSQLALNRKKRKLAEQKVRERYLRNQPITFGRNNQVCPTIGN